MKIPPLQTKRHYPEQFQEPIRGTFFGVFSLAFTLLFNFSIQSTLAEPATTHQPAAAANKIVKQNEMGEPLSEKQLEALSQTFQKHPWVGKSPLDGKGYMRKIDDEGWKLRFRLLQQAAQSGEKSFDILLRQLETDAQGDVVSDATLRIFAAQALEFMAHKPKDATAFRKVLLQRAGQDKNPAVRLYAAEALGKQGGNAAALAELLKRERHRDVRKFLQYAVARKKSVDSVATKQLADYDLKQLDSAALGKLAPDFTLSSLQGKTFRLSDFRKKKTVVLVFIYGDT